MSQLFETSILDKDKEDGELIIKPCKYSIALPSSWKPSNYNDAYERCAKQRAKVKESQEQSQILMENPGSGYPKANVLAILDPHN
ncbi:hypothetical protein V6N13_011124 [Hibiscus sabdariffa]|uniref:Uncharacterized protein n=1 Tax=Hibiscus sabdariffa TaxID=183260 RepID=A0ABR2SBB9_9ROSI